LLTDNNTANEIIIDQLKLKRMLFKILSQEKQNINTRLKNEQDMIKLIKNIIEEEADC
jgi:hypothetical protein